MAHKIALIEIQQETNSFSPVLTTLEDFKTFCMLTGDAILPEARQSKFQTGGFMKAAKEYSQNITIVPVVCAWAQSGGPLTTATYQFFKDTIQQQLALHPDLAGIWLSVHGAMGVEQLYDPEGELIEWIRTLVGHTLPIAMPLDLHANITARMVRHATFITAYRTNPHRDHFEVGYKSAKLLFETVLGHIKPTMAYRKMPLLKGGGYNIDFLKPMNRIFRWMNRVERNPKVLSIGNFTVHIWLDEPELGWAAVVVTNDDQPLAEQLADELAAMNWEVRAIEHPTPDTPQQALQKTLAASLRRKMGAVIWCDVSDIVSAGAPGENTWLLKEITDHAPQLVAYLPIRDAEAARQAYQLPLGNTVTLSLGGKLETVYNRPYSFGGEIIHKFESQQTGKIVVVKNAGTHAIISEKPCSVTKPQFFEDLNLSIWKADLVVVKNLFPFRYFFWKYNRLTINVLSAGVTNVNVHQLDYKAIPRPIYPLDEVIDWQ